MKILTIAAAFCAALVVPAFGASYQIDFALGSSNGTSGYYVPDNYTSEQEFGDISISGTIETDGTLGEITEDNIVALSLSVKSQQLTETFTMGAPGFVSFNAAFFATTDRLFETASGRYELVAVERITDSFNNYTDFKFFELLNVPASGGVDARETVYLERLMRTCENGVCSPNSVNIFESATSRRPLGSEILFNAQAVTPVPLPASALLLLAGLGGFGFLRRRKA